MLSNNFIIESEKNITFIGTSGNKNLDNFYGWLVGWLFMAQDPEWMIIFMCCIYKVCYGLFRNKRKFGNMDNFYE